MTQDLTSRETAKFCPQCIAIAEQHFALLAAKEQAEVDRDAFKIQYEARGEVLDEVRSQIIRAGGLTDRTRTISEAITAVAAQRDALKALCGDLAQLAKEARLKIRATHPKLAAQIDDAVTRAAELLAQWGMK